MATPSMSDQASPTLPSSWAVQVPLLRCSTSGWPLCAASSLWPTAHTSPPLTATAWSRPLLRPAVGTSLTFQCLPSQCSTKGASLCRPLRWPTAQMLSGPSWATPNRWLPLVPGLGLGTTDQLLPFQCSTRVWNTPLRNCCSPTAQTSCGETAVAENRMSRWVLSLGDLLMCQAEPFQDSIRLWALKALF